MMANNGFQATSALTERPGQVSPCNTAHTATSGDTGDANLYLPPWMKPVSRPPTVRTSGSSLAFCLHQLAPLTGPFRPPAVLSKKSSHPEKTKRRGQVSPCNTPHTALR